MELRQLPVEVGSLRARCGVVLAAGGTGGHFYPAVALAEQLRRLAPELPIMLLGTTGDRGVDLSGQLPEGVERRVVPMQKRETGLRALGRYLAGSAAVLAWLRGVLTRFARRGVLVSFGGYAAVPAAVAARSLGWHVVLFEPNVVPGRANRCLLALADLVCAGTPETLRRMNPRCPALVTGVPVRDRIVRAAAVRRVAERPEGTPRVVAAVGGSQGAQSLNHATVKLAEMLADRQVWIVHQTGVRHWPAVRRMYADRALEACVVPHVAEMDDLYRMADLLVMRAGASAIAEAAVCQVPCVLIPYPHAADDHQRQNACYVADRLGWPIVSEAPPGCIEPAVLGQVVIELLERSGRPGAGAAAELAALHRDAARRVAEQVLKRCA